MKLVRKRTAVGTMIGAMWALARLSLAALPAAAQTAGADVPATALENGGPSIASGRAGIASDCPGPAGPVADAEIYDPGTGAFSSTGSTMSGRYGHNQVRLDDGRLLVAGGVEGCTGSKTGSSALFDPSTNQLRPTGSMSTGRSSFPMHKLADGDVVVFGGEVSGGFAQTTDRIEKYDVSTGLWSIVGYLSQRKAGMGSCAMADGTILLVGGHNRDDDNDPVRTRSAEIFDPATNRTRLLPATTKFEHGKFVEGLTLQDGRCLIVSAGIGIRAEIFEPNTETFSIVPSLPGYENASTTTYFMSTLPDGTILHVGSPSMIFDPTSSSFRFVPH